jgi:hypothetical protein
MMAEHTDEDPLNNRRGNLREATNRQNQANQRSARADSTTGIRGVFRRGERFRSSIQIDGRRRTLGTFDTAEQAAAAYRIAHAEEYGEFSPYSDQGGAGEDGSL